MVDWRDASQRQAALTPTVQRPPNDDIYYYRVNGDLYVVVPRSQWKRLREQGKLESFLDKRRKSGVVVVVSDQCS